MPETAPETRPGTTAPGTMAPGTISLRRLRAGGYPRRHHRGRPAVSAGAQAGDQADHRFRPRGRGEAVRRRSLTVHYRPDQLIGRQVCAVVNFPPRQIGPFISEVLTLGMPDEDGAVVLIRTGLQGAERRAAVLKDRPPVGQRSRRCPGVWPAGADAAPKYVGILYTFGRGCGGSACPSGPWRCGRNLLDGDPRGTERPRMSAWFQYMSEGFQYMPAHVQYISAGFQNGFLNATDFRRTRRH